MNKLLNRPIFKTWIVLLIALLHHPLSATEQGIETFGVDKNGVRHVTATEAADILRQHPNVKVLDVRTGVEFNQGHLAGAVNVNYYSFNFKRNLETLDKNTIWLVHCRSGVRSGKSLPILKSLGFSSIIHLDGGTAAWTRAGLPLQKI